MVEDNKDTSQSYSQNKTEVQEVNIFPALTERGARPVSSIRREREQNRPGTQISIFAPVTFDEALDIVECLRGRAATTISLENMKKIDANRLVDFVAGASAALNGDFHKLSEQVYLFCPSNIKITAPNKQQAASAAFSTTFEGAGSLDFLYPSSSVGTQPTGWSQ